jgi:hypothetical protein
MPTASSCSSRSWVSLRPPARPRAQPADGPARIQSW